MGKYISDSDSVAGANQTLTIEPSEEGTYRLTRVDLFTSKTNNDVRWFIVEGEAAACANVKPGSKRTLVMSEFNKKVGTVAYGKIDALKAASGILGVDLPPEDDKAAQNKMLGDMFDMFGGPDVSGTKPKDDIFVQVRAAPVLDATTGKPRIAAKSGRVISKVRMERIVD